jgi:beta-galactosidase
VATLTCDGFLLEYFKTLTVELGLTMLSLPKDVRVVQRGQYAYLFNYAGYSQTVPSELQGQYVLGTANLAVYDVAIVKLA